jgi:rfaE bifunctional protein nucleotidyltransferase chain/domain
MEQPPAVVAVPDLPALREYYRRKRLRVVSTNGCFDIIHAAHVRMLERARRLGDVLVVGLNDDESVRLIKGPTRPLVPQADRADMLASLKCVDHVLVFSGLLPNEWLSLLQPDIHCKSADYDADALPEARIVRQHGGRVEILPLEPGYSTSDLLSRVAAAVEADRQKSPAAIPAAAAKSADPVADIIHAMLQTANDHRQLAYRLAPGIAAVASNLAAARGHNVLVWTDPDRPWLAQGIVTLLKPQLGDRIRALQPGRMQGSPGDVVLAACAASSAPALCEAARVRGIHAIVLAPSLTGAAGADCVALCVASADPGAQPILQLAVVGAISASLARRAAGAQP